MQLGVAAGAAPGRVLTKMALGTPVAPQEQPHWASGPKLTVIVGSRAIGVGAGAGLAATKPMTAKRTTV